MDGIRAPGVLDSPEALVELALVGDEAAFARLVRLHRAAMIHTCFVTTLDTDLALEAVAAAWPLAWDRLGRLPDPARLRQWLCSIAVHEAREIVVHGSGRVDVGLWNADADRDRQPAQRSVVRDADLASRLARLQVDDRVLLALRYVAGLTPTELARATRIGPRAGTARISRLLEDLGGPNSGEREMTDAERRFAERLQDLANVPVGHVNIDAVARTAKITRGDRRIRLVSIGFALVAALVVVAVPYLGESGAWPAILAGAASPAPAPTMDTGPGSTERPY